MQPSTNHFTSLPSEIAPLQTRSHVAAALLSLINPLLPLFSPGRGLVTLPLCSTGTRHDFRSAQLEAFARPLWGLASLAAGSPSDVSEDLLQFWIDGLDAGTDPNGSEYWGKSRDRDQRMVEMCPLGYALCVIPKHRFWDKLSVSARANVAAWLGVVNDREMPNTNWLWFRVFANLALRTYACAEFDEQRLEQDLTHLDTFYRGGGWSNDGPEGYTQMDYYSGSFAIQVAQLVYVRVMKDEEGETVKGRIEEYTKRAQDFALDFLEWFDESGRALTFGRSLTYRFAVAGFWSALAYSEIELPAPLTQGMVKGLLLRNLRWWTSQKDILTSDGTLNIGYGYPNQFMSENYNSVGSTYWFMLGFIALALPEQSSFWKAEEEPHPVTADKQVRVKALKEAMMISVRSGGHSYMLTSGQMCHYPVRGGESKYGKLAYSTAFGYSVPTGRYDLESSGVDSTIALSDDNETWKVRRVPLHAQFEKLRNIPASEQPDSAYDIALSASWQPWPDVEVTTWLIPPVPGYENWHTRVHRIRTARKLYTCDAAFALKGIHEDSGRELAEVNWVILGRNMESSTIAEGRFSMQGQALASSSAGVVGITDLPIPTGYEQATSRQGQVLDEDANSNLLHSRTVLPSLRSEVEPSNSRNVWLVAAIFAVPAGQSGWQMQWKDRFERKPPIPKWVQEAISREQG